MSTVAAVEVESTAGAESSSYEKANLQTEGNFRGRVDLMADLQNFRFQNNSSTIPSLELAETLFKKGIDALQSHKYQDGVRFFDRALRIRVQHYGWLAHECGTTYLEYGRALYSNATVHSISQMYDDSESLNDESEDEEEDNDESSNFSGSSLADTETSSAPASTDERKDISNMEEKKAEGSEAPAIDDASSDNEGLHCRHCEFEMEEEDKDLDLAWKMLNIARRIFEKDKKANYLYIADCSRILGDISLEREDLESFLKNYTKVVTIFEGTRNPDGPHIALLLCNMSLALTSQGRVAETLNYRRRAVRVIKSWLYRVENGVQRIEAELPVRAYDSAPATPKNLAFTAHEKQKIIQLKGEDSNPPFPTALHCFSPFFKFKL
ncbi:hypothetical protein SUGI_0282330 [Cryptomeria japonica]|uniref:uncharacterized protein LOC131078633 n=1 Tax=Cryptomeria japonica TaxID=3369 RepID=UPI002408EFF4|nr:uncharacterized protein LOC131078633 [Cryptomeria japonica]GLJ16525.1 hypothetical protein SUGI_0282330 [Cryptomeria japonica]